MPERLGPALGPVCLRGDFPAAPANLDWRTVLDGIAAAGYCWTELGPIGYLPEALGPELAARGLGLTAGFVFEPLHDPSRHAEAAAAARAVAQRVSRLGGRFLVVIDAVTGERARTAGQPAAAPRLDRDAVAGLRSLIREIASVAEACGVVPVL